MAENEEWAKEWHGIKGISCIAQSEGSFVCRFGKTNEENVEVIVDKVAFENFPGEPIPKLEDVHITISKQMSFVTGFPKQMGHRTIITANFKEPARIRKEMFSLFIFKDNQ